MLINFGDDYRNFIDSLSESHSSISIACMDSKKRSKRLIKKKLVTKQLKLLKSSNNNAHCCFQTDTTRHNYDTCSDTDLDDVNSVLADSQKEIYSVETNKSLWEEDGFVRTEHYAEYVRDKLLVK